MVKKNPPANVAASGDTGSILGSGRSPRGGNGNWPQYSCLGNPLGREDPLGEEMATGPRILAWDIPWTEEPGRLQSTESPRVGQDLVSEHTRDRLVRWVGREEGSDRRLSEQCRCAWGS